MILRTSLNMETKEEFCIKKSNQDKKALMESFSLHSALLSSWEALR